MDSHEQRMRVSAGEEGSRKQGEEGETSRWRGTRRKEAKGDEERRNFVSNLTDQVKRSQQQWRREDEEGAVATEEEATGGQEARSRQQGTRTSELFAR